MTDQHEEPDYFLEIESRFAELRMTPFIFSSKDWVLMKGWKESGIPLPVVIEALESCFQKRSEGGRKRVISSLSYCRHAVQEIWNDRKELYVGRSGESVPEHDPFAQLLGLAEQLEKSAEQNRPAVAAELQRVAAILRTPGRARSVPDIEDELLILEQSLLESIAAALGPEARGELDAAVAAQLNGMRTLDDATMERTRRANFKRILRQRLAIPRLSLFS